MVVIVVFYHGGKASRSTSRRVMRDLNWAANRLKRQVLIPTYRPEAEFAR